MELRARYRWLTVPVLCVAFAGAAKAGDVPAEPHYDTATVVSLDMVVTEVREVTKGQPMAGIHLLARLESSKADSETTDVWVGPVDFVKMFEITFHKDDHLSITGSKSKFAGAQVILAREVRRSDTTLYIRDAKGDPVWKYLLKSA